MKVHELKEILNNYDDTAAVMKWLNKHGLKPDFYESISSVQAHGIDDYFRKK